MKKTYYILKHILLSEKLFNKPYYNLIVFCSTSNGLDKTVLAFKDKIKTPLVFLSDTELLPFLEEHVKQKMRYYSMYRFVMNNFENPDDTMNEIIRLNGIQDGIQNSVKIFCILFRKAYTAADFLWNIGSFLF